MNSRYATSYREYSMNPTEAEALRKQLKDLTGRRRELEAKINRARKADVIAEYTDELNRISPKEAALEEWLKAAPPLPVPEETVMEMMIGTLVTELRKNQGYLARELELASQTLYYSNLLDDSFVKRSAEAELFLELMVKINKIMGDLEAEQLEKGIESHRASNLANALAQVVDYLTEHVLHITSYPASYGGLRAVKEQARITAMADFVQDHKSRTYPRLAESAEVWTWMQANR